MKRCPECRRDYYDDTLLYCLDDGNELLEGPASGQFDEPQTAILHSTAAPGEAPTRAQFHNTEQTSVSARGVEAEPHESLADSATKHSPHANQVAKPLLVVAVIATVALGSFFGYRYLPSANSKQIESIAVMPFENGTGDPDLEYLSDGMTETLIGTLSRLQQVKVKARSLVFRYKGKDADAKTVASELGVQALLNGRLTKRGDQLAINLELVEAETGDVIWSDNYERSQADLVSLQKEIWRDVSSRLESIAGTEQVNAARNISSDSEAYELYLKGRFYWNLRGADNLKRALELFEQAVAKDPNYALAHTGIADAYSLLPVYNVMTPREGMPKAKEAALKALALDDSLAEAHTALALVLCTYDYDFVAAEREYKRAIELDPGYGTAHMWYGEMLRYLGRMDEAIRETGLALQTDPQSPIMTANHGISFFNARQFDKAVQFIEDSKKLGPVSPLGNQVMFQIYQIQGKQDEAISSIASLYELLVGQQDADAIRNAYLDEGWNAAIRKVIEAEKRSMNRAWELANFYVILGDHDKAFAELDRAYQERGFTILQIRTSPALDGIRDDPRYKELVRKIPFPD